jgi:hypothetical protein
MEKILSYITRNFISVVGITILTGTTLTTSALGVMKVANNFEKTKIEVPEVKETEPAITPLISPTPSNPQQIVGNTNTVSHPKAVIPAKTVIIPTLPLSTSSTTQANAAQCTITLFGKQYDVSNLRNTHSGGNIFNCGTDMTAIYQGRHGTDLSRMQQYLITSGGTTSSNTASGGTNSTSNTGGASTPTTSTTKTEIHKENEQEEKSEIHNEDHEEEEKTHLESFLHDLRRLLAS